MSIEPRLKVVYGVDKAAVLNGHRKVEGGGGGGAGSDPFFGVKFAFGAGSKGVRTFYVGIIGRSGKRLASPVAATIYPIS